MVLRTSRLCTPLEWLLLWVSVQILSFFAQFSFPRWFCGSNSQLGTATSSAMESFFLASWQFQLTTWAFFNSRGDMPRQGKRRHFFLTPRDQRKAEVFSPGWMILQRWFHLTEHPPETGSFTRHQKTQRFHKSYHQTKNAAMSSIEFFAALAPQLQDTESESKRQMIHELAIRHLTSNYDSISSPKFCRGKHD